MPYDACSMTVEKTSLARPALIAVCFVWTGMVLGLSFLETPLKFTAPSVTLPIGLEIGRRVFGALNLIEIILTIVSIALVLLARARLHRGIAAALVGVWVIVAAESLWLLPALDERAVRIIAGEALPSTYHHVLYIVLESTEVLLLVGAGIGLLAERRLKAPVARSERDRPPRSTS